MTTITKLKNKAITYFCNSKQPNKFVGVHYEDFAISRQLDDYSCGSRCVYMVLRHLSRSCTHTRLKEKLGTDRQDGTSERAMRKLFRQRGLKATVSELSWPSLKKALARGAILIVTVDDGEHYIVVHGMTHDEVHLADPLEYLPRRRVMSRRKFLDRWDRWGLVIRA